MPDFEAEHIDSYDDGEASALAFEVDIHRGIVMLPRYERGRRVLPCLYEAPIVDLLDEDGDIMLADDDPADAAFAVVHVSGDIDSIVAVETDYTGRTIH